MQIVNVLVFSVLVVQVYSGGHGKNQKVRFKIQVPKLINKQYHTKTIYVHVHDKEPHQEHEHHHVHHHDPHPHHVHHTHHTKHHTYHHTTQHHGKPHHHHHPKPHHHPPPPKPHHPAPKPHHHSPKPHHSPPKHHPPKETHHHTPPKEHHPTPKEVHHHPPPTEHHHHPPPKKSYFNPHSKPPAPVQESEAYNYEYDHNYETHTHPYESYHLEPFLPTVHPTYFQPKPSAFPEVTTSFVSAEEINEGFNEDYGEEINEEPYHNSHSLGANEEPVYDSYGLLVGSKHDPFNNYQFPPLQSNQLGLFPGPFKQSAEEIFEQEGQRYEDAREQHSNDYSVDEDESRVVIKSVYPGNYEVPSTEVPLKHWKSSGTNRGRSRFRYDSN